ncbi:hypothetical protein CITSP_05033 [Citrobacter sp. T1.2D-1]|nr:hypothetical protein CITSP_05033 [Citrobacter sp. T1.2D-1]
MPVDRFVWPVCGVFCLSVIIRFLFLFLFLFLLMIMLPVWFR